MSLDTAEQWIRILGAIPGLASLAYAILAMFRSLRRPIGREEGGARIALRAPVLIVATLLFLLAGALTWRPLPIEPPPWIRALLLAVGALSMLDGLALYLWGMRALGQMFGPSSGFGIRLHAQHHLVTAGPYAFLRHPMYLGVISAAVGSLLLYRTWATLAFAIMMFGTVVRARREERVLAEEFGAEWEAYAHNVRPWLPRLGSKQKRGA